MQSNHSNRRSVIKSVLAAFASFPLWTRAQAQTAPTAKLDEKDPQAITLGYVADAAKVDAKKNPTYKPGQTCATCVLLTGKDGDAYRPCAVFPGKLVASAGWCRSWVKKG
jgi:hypothetical protein